jgi:hypothetical protein
MRIDDRIVVEQEDKVCSVFQCVVYTAIVPSSKPEILFHRKNRDLRERLLHCFDGAVGGGIVNQDNLQRRIQKLSQ